MNVVVRFAPSPTGLIHIGGMRVALINYVFAKQNGGKFILRIEDTDQQRYKPEFVESIDRAMGWLGLTPDERIVQSAGIDRYAQAVNTLLDKKRAYYCYCTPEELQEKREEAIQKKITYKYDGKCRGNHTLDSGKPYVIRVDTSAWTEVSFDDLIYGPICATESNINDAVIMRANGLPTFLFAASVDDAASGITHIIRGNDHITNTAQQIVMLQLMDRPLPTFAHIPLLLDMSGSKLSKRHGAADLNYYKQLGFLPEAIKNYLASLGGGLANKELALNDAELSANFALGRLKLSPARFDVDKLSAINGIHMRKREKKEILPLFAQYYQDTTGKALSEVALNRIDSNLGSILERACTLAEIIEIAGCYLKPRPIVPDEFSREFLAKHGQLLATLYERLCGEDPWEELHLWLKAFIKSSEIKTGDAFTALRAAIVGSKQSLPMTEVMVILGKEESLSRIEDALKKQCT